MTSKINTKVVRELLEMGFEAQKRVSHKYPINYYLTRICFGVYGMVDSLKKLHQGSEKGYFDYNLYSTHLFATDIVEEHYLCSTTLKSKIVNLKNKYHRGDDLLKKRGSLGICLKDNTYLKEITSEAIDYYSTILYPEALEMLISEIKEAISSGKHIALEKMYSPSEDEKELMALFIKNLYSHNL